MQSCADVPDACRPSGEDEDARRGILVLHRAGGIAVLYPDGAGLRVFVQPAGGEKMVLRGYGKTFTLAVELLFLLGSAAFGRTAPTQP